jgi:GNAT superfamily N-acetyltransferase
MSDLRGIASRPLAVDDAGELLTLQRAAYVSEALIYGDPALPALTQTFEEMLREFEHLQASGLFLGPRLVAAARHRLDGTTVHIQRIVVVPDLQGRGLGSAVLALAERATTAERAEAMTGTLSRRNLRFLRLHGYGEVRRARMRPTVEAVVLAKDLSS